MSEKPRDLDRQLVLLICAAAVDLVVDVGANTGQYGRRLRRGGYTGRILSFEPQPAVCAALAEAVAADLAWTVAEPLALGRHPGRARFQVSAESDMSSLYPQTSTLVTLSPSSHIVEHIDVDVATLEERLSAVAGDRLFVKVDVQGGDEAVLDGLAGAWSRVVGVQLELALTKLYDGDVHYLAMCHRLEQLGYRLALVLPGYFDGKVKRQLQFDGVFVRED
ncbi:MAG: FkbM family methyltransferase [Pseudomonadota bacterium]